MREAPLTQHIRPHQEPLDLRGYESVGGYQGFQRALREHAPQEITRMVKDARLRGRGGAGFPTGVKWGLVPTGPDAPQPRYLVCNADEMEPGSFKDRFLLEGNPHQLLEGMMLSAYALGTSVAYIFLRAEYRLAARRLTKAIEEAYQAGYLGEDIQGSGFGLNLYLHQSAGRYICGEETALLNALEGKRAIPRAKPPFPQLSGLWGKPTIVQNVETLCNISHIVSHGPEWFLGLSDTEEGGTKLYGVSGKVKRPGLWELPLGTTLREVLEEHAGGMHDGLRFRGVLPGGASTDFLVEEHLDTRMDFDTLMKVGSRLGTGTLIVLDDQTCPVGFVHNLERFFAQESCGWCTPCRDGLPWVARSLQALEEGQGQARDLEVLEMHPRLIGLGSTFCALAPGAMEPLQSALRFFRSDFEKHIEEKRCPWS